MGTRRSTSDSATSSVDCLNVANTVFDIVGLFVLHPAWPPLLVSDNAPGQLLPIAVIVFVIRSALHGLCSMRSRQKGTFRHSRSTGEPWPFWYKLPYQSDPYRVIMIYEPGLLFVVGDRPNNRGVIEVSSNPGRAVVERVTNAIDAVLDAEFVAHDGKPAVGSPREAATTWLNVPDDGLSGMTAAERRKLAKRVTVRLRGGSGPEKRVIEVHDRGIGLSAEQMPTTILSL